MRQKIVERLAPHGDQTRITGKRSDVGSEDRRIPVIAPGHTFKSVTEEISRIVLTAHTPLGWYFGFMLAGSIVIMLLTAVGWLFLKASASGAWISPSGWGFAIINFVWWIGIGHAGTLISAILLLFKQQWRNSINRFAEAMTIFAVICAGMFPLST